LTSAERETVSAYLAAKYALPNIPVPGTPGNMAAVSVSDTQVAVSWSPGTPGRPERSTPWKGNSGREASPV